MESNREHLTVTNCRDHGFTLVVTSSLMVVAVGMGGTGSTVTGNPTPVNAKVSSSRNPAFPGTYRILIPGTMASGDWINVPVNGTNPKSNGNSVEYTLPAGQGRFFTRLEVTPN